MRWQLASTFAAIAMSGCYEEATIPCPNGVLCPADQACTGNSVESGLPLCGNVDDVEVCANREPDADGGRPLCMTSDDRNGVCEAGVCALCAPDMFECRYSEWTAMSPVAFPLNDVYVASRKEAYAVGGAGHALTYDGIAWRANIVGIDVGEAPMTSVWGGPGGRIAVTSNRNVLLSDATGSMSTSTTNQLRGLWGNGASTFAVGSEEVIGKYAVATSTWSWSTPDTFGVGYLAVWGWNDAVAVVGADGTVVTITDTTTQSIQIADRGNGAHDTLFGVWGMSSSDFYAVGSYNLVGTIWHYDGVSWTEETVPSGPELLAIWGTSDRIYVVGDGGTILQKTPGTAWTRMPTPATPRLTSIFGVDRDVIAVGESGTILRLALPN